MTSLRQGLAVPVAELADLGARLWPGSRRRLAILMYHGLVERRLEPFCWHQLPLEAFERQVRWVSRNLHPLPLEEALDRLVAGTLPPRACALTFDDGYRSVRDLALPLLAALGLHATVFLITDLVGTAEVPWPDRLYLAVRATSARALDAGAAGLGILDLSGAERRAEALGRALTALKALPAPRKRVVLAQWLEQLGAPPDPDPGEFRLLDWEDVRALGATGHVAFGAHTTRHEILSRLSDDEVRETIARSQGEVARRLGRMPRVFAYPNGRAVDFDARASQAVGALGVPYALSTVEGLAEAGSDPFALPRVNVGSDLPYAVFRLRARGLWPRRA